MIQLSLLAADMVNTYPTALPGWKEFAIMSATCLLVLFIASRTIECPRVGPKMPLPFSKLLFNDPSVGTFLGSMSFGHVLGTLAILGLGPYLK